jgi:hypothetical protein
VTPIIPSDLPYVAAFIAVAVLLFWMMDWVARRPSSTRQSWNVIPPVLSIFYFGYVLVIKISERAWLAAIIPALGIAWGITAIWAAWRKKQRRKSAGG